MEDKKCLYYKDQKIAEEGDIIIVHFTTGEIIKGKFFADGEDRAYVDRQGVVFSFDYNEVIEIRGSSIK